MNRQSMLIVAVLGVAFGAVGCQKEPYMHLIKPDRSAGESRLAMIGTSQRLLEQGRIEHHKRIEMPDGAEMDLWVIGAKTSQGSPAPKGAVVLIHDFGGSKADMFDLGKAVAQKGYDVVLPDLRAHGRSGGKYFTYGVCESEDIRNIMHSLGEEKLIHPPIYVYGDVIGGTVAIQYAAADDRCAGVVASRPLRDFETSAKVPLRLYSKQEFEKYVSKAGQVGGFVPKNASALKAAEKLNCPMLLIDRKLKLGEALVKLNLDPLLLPEANSRAIYQAAPGPKKIISINPGLEEIIVGIGWNDWQAQKIDELASGKIADIKQPEK